MHNHVLPVFDMKNQKKNYSILKCHFWMNAEILFFLYSKDNWKKILSSVFEQNSINIALYLKLLKTWTFSNYKIKGRGQPRFLPPGKIGGV